MKFPPLHSPLKKTGEVFEIAGPGDEVWGYVVGSVDPDWLVVQVEARQGTVYTSIPAASLRRLETECSH